MVGFGSVVVRALACGPGSNLVRTYDHPVAKGYMNPRFGEGIDGYRTNLVGVERNLTPYYIKTI